MGQAHARQYAKLAAQTRLPEPYRTMQGGLGLAKELLDPVLAGSYAQKFWNHQQLSWDDSRAE